ncbi:MAG: hypothetical protein ACRDJX_05460 [Solirubrobacteraceae bacterium]
MIYIAVTGTPCPIETVQHGGEADQTTFTGWKDSVRITPPAHAVELQSLERHAKG